MVFVRQGKVGPSNEKHGNPLFCASCVTVRKKMRLAALGISGHCPAVFQIKTITYLKNTRQVLCPPLDSRVREFWSTGVLSFSHYSVFLKARGHEACFSDGLQ